MGEKNVWIDSNGIIHTEEQSAAPVERTEGERLVAIYKAAGSSSNGSSKKKQTTSSSSNGSSGKRRAASSSSKGSPKKKQTTSSSSKGSPKKEGNGGCLLVVVLMALWIGFVFLGKSRGWW